jgi:hypothetical protein
MALLQSGDENGATITDNPVTTPESSSKGETIENTITLRKLEAPGPEFKTWIFPWQLSCTWSVSLERHRCSQLCSDSTGPA